MMNGDELDLRDNIRSRSRGHLSAVDAIGPKMESGRTWNSPRHNNPNFRSGRVIL